MRIFEWMWTKQSAKGFLTFRMQLITSPIPWLFGNPALHVEIYMWNTYWSCTETLALNICLEHSNTFNFQVPERALNISRRSSYAELDESHSKASWSTSDCSTSWNIKFLIRLRNMWAKVAKSTLSHNCNQQMKQLAEYWAMENIVAKNNKVEELRNTIIYHRDETYF